MHYPSLLRIDSAGVAILSTCPIGTIPSTQENYLAGSSFLRRMSVGGFCGCERKMSPGGFLTPETVSNSGSATRGYVSCGCFGSRVCRGTPS
jgi:hypothetical protein